MSDNKRSPSRFREDLLLALLPSLLQILLAGFLVTGAVELFKQESSFRLEVMEKFYMPFMDDFQAAIKANNDYCTAIGEEAAGMRLLLTQMDRIQTDPDAPTTLTDRTMILSFGNQFHEAQEHVKRAKIAKSDAYAILYLKARELSIVTGNLKSFVSITKELEAAEKDVIAKATTASDSFLAKEGISSDPLELLKQYQSKMNNFDGRASQEDRDQTIAWSAKLGRNSAQLFEMQFNAEAAQMKVTVDGYQKLQEMFEQDLDGRFRKGLISRAWSHLF
ncbi:hypothetical protein SAMN05444156_3103 [Verrucomicrobium sp. GAS474]|uniref:hypothetical protein n=1 Tax=Verrucomicrobium sp. GAS474 TaxID=1882831 RepID=UPI000879C882|nr:hypothetical protein [Verrucomicrobium sp. GAS474]SDU29094.1 hypothetical protein SAMN05444156_3103 [Verrucomicrobium sp. GAS474]